MAEEKGFRLLSLYDQLVNRGSIQKKEAAQVFGVSERSIQRDIEQLRNFFAEQTPPLEIHYDPGQNSYRLSEGEGAFLSCGEMLAVCKILLESRSLSKRELDQILDKLLVHGMRLSEREKLQEIISNERHFYVEPRHGKPLVDILWKLGQAIQTRSEIEADYQTQTGEKKHRRLQPVGLMCSEFYFYLAAFLKNVDRNQEFEYPEDPYPTIYRVDRLEQIQVQSEHFTVPYSQRFSEGEFRKRVQFMYGGRLRTVHFLYKGPSVEAVLDRLPTAEIVGERDGTYEIRAEVFGKGIDMWMKSQGALVEIL